jgi:hypothetical protein
MTIGTIAGVTVLIEDILSGTKLEATDLLGRGAALWVTNVIVFSLWFWELDRGAPAERAAGSGIPPSFAFPENATPELAPEGWAPIYPDYLYLAFTNATAFSPTDTLPVKTWAKMMMMLQSAVSLVTAILVIARAINVLPGAPRSRVRTGRRGARPHRPLRDRRGSDPRLRGDRHPVQRLAVSVDVHARHRRNAAARVRRTVEAYGGWVSTTLPSVRP